MLMHISNFQPVFLLRIIKIKVRIICVNTTKISLEKSTLIF